MRLKEGIEFIVFLAVVIVFLVVFLFLTQGLLDAKICKEKCSMQDFTCHYGFFTGCMVNTSGKWIEYKLKEKYGD